MAFRVEIEPPEIPAMIAGTAPAKLILRARERAVNQAVLFLSRIMTEVSPTGGTFLLQQSWGAGRRLAQIVGNSVVGKVASAGAAGIEALVWDKGTKNNPFPPVRKRVLRQWIQRQLSQPFIVRKGKRVPANLRKTRHVTEIAFAISRAIKRRGLPNPEHPLNRKKGLFTRAFNASQPEVRRIFDQMNQNLVARFGGK